MKKKRNKACQESPGNKQYQLLAKITEPSIAWEFFDTTFDWALQFQSIFLNIQFIHADLLSIRFMHQEMGSVQSSEEGSTVSPVYK